MRIECRVKKLNSVLLCSIMISYVLAIALLSFYESMILVGDMNKYPVSFLLLLSIILYTIIKITKIFMNLNVIRLRKKYNKYYDNETSITIKRRYDKISILLLIFTLNSYNSLINQYKVDDKLLENENEYSDNEFKAIYKLLNKDYNTDINFLFFKIKFN